MTVCAQCRQSVRGRLLMIWQDEREKRTVVVHRPIEIFAKMLYHKTIPHRMMSGSKAPDFDAYGLFRAAHSHVSAPLRPVLDMCHWHIAPYPIFAYRGIIIPLLCSYRGGAQGLSPTYEQAHVGLAP